jgi:hypothetical protein
LYSLLLLIRSEEHRWGQVVPAVKEGHPALSMLSPVTNHHHHGSAAGGNTTPSQLRSAVAGIWSSVLSSGGNGNNGLPNHGIPVASTFDKLLEKHHQTLAQLKLSDPDLSETITRGFRRFQNKMRESQSQTNASVQCIGIPYLYTELHETVRYEIAQAKVLQIQAQQQQERTKNNNNNNVLSSPETDRKFRIARELAEARIKAQQALQLQNKNQNKNSSSDDNDDNISLASSSASTASEDHVVDGQQQQPLSSPVMKMMPPSSGQNSPTSVIVMDDDIHEAAGASSSYVHLTPQQKHALLSVHDVDDEDDIQEVPTADNEDDSDDDSDDE